MAIATRSTTRQQDPTIPSLSAAAERATSASTTSTKRKRLTDCEINNNNTATPTKYARRRKNAAVAASGSIEVVDLTGDSPTATPVTKKQRTTTKAKASPSELILSPEKRAKRFRSHPPQAFLERKHRAMTQRLCIVGHSVSDVNGVLEISFDVVGSIGNIYKTVIGKVPYCSCPDNLKGNQCKHICYVLVNALKAPAHLQYQLAFLSTELREMYEGSPLSREQSESEENVDGNRKPIEGECPICFMEFEPEKEDIVWCRARCGNNIHKTCFRQWANTQQAHGVRCVYCRSPWEDEKVDLDIKNLVSKGTVNEEGYVNVADQLGLSRVRDYSTYSSWWGHSRSSSYGRSYYGRRMW